MSNETTTGNVEQSEGVAGVGMFVAAFVDELDNFTEGRIDWSGRDICAWYHY